MFILSRISDVVKLSPATFSIPTLAALTSAINAKFSNRVIMDVGLCICLYDILQASDGTVKAGDGCSYVTVEFRLVVFRPFIGEILTGKISSSSPDGIKVSLGFFDDIFIPKSFLFEDTVFDDTEQTWVWKTEDSDQYLDTDEAIRFRIEEESFVDCTPGRKGEIAEQRSPYSLVASCQVSGLGNVAWWEN